MKKSTIALIVLAALAAISLIVYLNRTSATKSSSAAPQSAASEPGAQAQDPSMPGQPDLRRPDSPRPDVQMATPEKDKSIDSYFARSGFSRTLGFMQEKLNEEFDHILNDPNATPQEREAAELVKKKLNAEAISAEYRRILNEQFSEQELARLDEVYQDPEVQKFAERQAYMMTPEGQKELAADLKRSRNEKISPEKAEAIRGFAKNQMESLPSDHSMFDASPEIKEAMSKQIEEEVSRSLEPLLKGRSPAEIRSLTEKYSEPVVRRALEAQTRLMMNTLEEIIKMDMMFK